MLLYSMGAVVGAVLSRIGAGAGAGAGLGAGGGSEVVAEASASVTRASSARSSWREVSRCARPIRRSSSVACARKLSPMFGRACKGGALPADTREDLRREEGKKRA